VGVHEKGVSALESLLFAKYQMYRNVYWHHAVRSATCMFKRAVREAVAAGALNPAEVSDATDDVVMEQLTRNGSELARAVRGRRLFKRAMELPASDVPSSAREWVSWTSRRSWSESRTRWRARSASPGRTADRLSSRSEHAERGPAPCA
jgi:HD superfamily phosphohydrolase